jgi:hypothetical protein
MRLSTSLALCLVLLPSFAAAQQPASPASGDVYVDLPDGTAVELHAESEDPSREIHIELRVPGPLRRPVPPRRASFGDAYVVALEGFAIASLVGGGLGVAVAAAIADDASRDAPTLVAGFAGGAAFVGPFGPGISLGTMSNGAPNGGLFALIGGTFLGWLGAGAAAIGPIGTTGEALGGTLIAFLASAVISPLISALIFQAMPMGERDVLQVTASPGGIAGVF